MKDVPLGLMVACIKELIHAFVDRGLVAVVCKAVRWVVMCRNRSYSLLQVIKSSVKFQTFSDVARAF